MGTELIILAIGILLSVAAYFLAPKPKPPPPQEAGEFEVPRAEQGKEIGKAYGTVWIDSPQIVWFGDQLSSPIYASGGKK